MKHQRISSQIALIEDELAQLTVVELERREFRQEEEMVSDLVDKYCVHPGYLVLTLLLFTLSIWRDMLA